MYTVTLETEFSAAHLIRGYNGPCSRLHGHNWKVTVEVTTDVLDQLGAAGDGPITARQAPGHAVGGAEHHADDRQEREEGVDAQFNAHPAAQRDCPASHT